MSIIIHYSRFDPNTSQDLTPILLVSIHAPAWGATHYNLEDYLKGAVSIHAPAWGATILCVPDLPPTFQFQSTPPHGGRRHKK